ncbi:MAG: hypothetical protein ABIH35_03280 [Patescibacteria group bacterium]
MRDSPYFTTVSTFTVIAAVLAVSAALLPAGKTEVSEGLLKIEYGVEETTSPIFYGENEFDFLFFKLKPAKVELNKKVKRSSEETARRVLSISPAEDTAVRSEQHFVTVLQGNATTAVDEIAELVQQQYQIRTQAIRESNATGCNEIENSRAAANCRSEIYFQQAVRQDSVEECEKIESPELRRRCQNYFP